MQTDVDLEEELFGDLEEDSLDDFVERAYSLTLNDNKKVKETKPVADVPGRRVEQEHDGGVNRATTQSTTQPIKESDNALQQGVLPPKRELHQRPTQPRIASQRYFKLSSSNSNARATLVNTMISERFIENLPDQENSEVATLYNNPLALLSSTIQNLGVPSVLGGSQKTIQYITKRNEVLKGLVQSNLSVAEEVEKRLENVDLKDFSNVGDAFLVNGDPQYKCSVMDTAFNQALQSLVDEGGICRVPFNFLIEYLSIVFSTSPETCTVSKFTQSSIQHLHLRKQIRGFTLERVGSCLSAILQHQINTILAQQDTIQYKEDVKILMQKGLRIMLCCTVLSYELLSKAEIVDNTWMPRRALYSVAYVVQHTAFLDLYNSISKQYKDWHCVQDASISKKITNILSLLEKNEIQKNLQIHDLMKPFDFRTVNSILRKAWETTTPFGKLELLVSANKQIPECVKIPRQSKEKLGLGADEILPVFIQCVMESMPVNLVSDIQFIKDMSDQTTLSGEAAYVVTMLSTAKEVIESMKIPSLS